MELHAGDLVPADGIVLVSQEALANEAILTGEAYPVRRETTRIIHAPRADRSVQRAVRRDQISSAERPSCWWSRRADNSLRCYR